MFDFSFKHAVELKFLTVNYKNHTVSKYYLKFMNNIKDFKLYYIVTYLEVIIQNVDEK